MNRFRWKSRSWKDGSEQGRSGAEPWTRVETYLADLAGPPAGDGQTHRRSGQSAAGRRYWLLLAGLGAAAAGLYASGALDRPAETEAPPAAAPAPTASEGLKFGLCDKGGGTNCVVDGQSFFLAGKAIRVAGIVAPATHSARCDGESLLGWAAAERLQKILGGGRLTTRPVPPGHDGNGRELREVRIDGRDVGQLLIAAGLARPAGQNDGWC